MAEVILLSEHEAEIERLTAEVEQYRASLYEIAQWDGNGVHPITVASNALAATDNQGESDD